MTFKYTLCFLICETVINAKTSSFHQFSKLIFSEVELIATSLIRGLLCVFIHISRKEQKNFRYEMS